MGCLYSWSFLYNALSQKCYFNSHALTPSFLLVWNLSHSVPPKRPVSFSIPPHFLHPPAREQQTVQTPFHMKGPNKTCAHYSSITSSQKPSSSHFQKTNKRFHLKSFQWPTGAHKTCGNVPFLGLHFIKFNN